MKIILVAFFVISSFSFEIYAKDSGFLSNGKFLITFFGREVLAPDGAEKLSLIPFHKEHKDSSLILSKRQASFFSKDTIASGEEKYFHVYQVNSWINRKDKRKVTMSDLHDFIQEGVFEIPTLEWLSLAINQGLKLPGRALVLTETTKRDINGSAMIPVLNPDNTLGFITKEKFLEEGFYVILMTSIPSEKREKEKIIDNRYIDDLAQNKHPGSN